jgi:hypothetical protein
MTQQHENQKGQYQCASCKQAFQTQNELREHEQSQHKSGQGSRQQDQKTGAAGQSHK